MLRDASFLSSFISTKSREASQVYTSRLKMQHQEKYSQQVQGNYCYYFQLIGNGTLSPVQERWGGEKGPERCYQNGQCSRT